MAAVRRVVLDDRLLIDELLVGLGARDVELHTTSCWYHRACRAAAAGAAGFLSGPFEQLEAHEQELAIRGLLELPDTIGLPDPRATVPAMAGISLRHPRLNLLSLEAAAAAQSLDATIWLSPSAAHGLLPAVLHAEGVAWRTIAIDE